MYKAIKIEILLIFLFFGISSYSQSVQDCNTVVGIISYEGKSNQCEVGQDAYFSVYINNKSANRADNIVAKIPVPNDMEFGMANAGNGNAGLSGGDVVWELPSLPAGSYAYMQLILRGKRKCVEQDVVFETIEVKGGVDYKQGGQDLRTEFVAGSESQCKPTLGTTDNKIVLRIEKLRPPELNTTLEYCPTIQENILPFSSRIVRAGDKKIYWYKNENDTTPMTTEPTFSTRVDKRTVYTAYVSQEDKMGCFSSKEKVEVIVDDKELPQLNLPADMEIRCPDVNAENRINAWLAMANAFDACSGRLQVKNNFAYTIDICDKKEVKVTFVARDRFGNMAEGFRKITFKSPEVDNKKPEKKDDKKCVLWFPNMFTPNGDGINDVFEIRGLDCFKDNSFKVFNRWGAEVFSVKGYDNVERVFKGFSDKGEKLPQGTYYYEFEYKMGDYNFSKKDWFVFSW